MLAVSCTTISSGVCPSKKVAGTLIPLGWITRLVMSGTIYISPSLLRPSSTVRCLHLGKPEPGLHPRTKYRADNHHWRGHLLEPLDLVLHVADALALHLGIFGARIQLALYPVYSAPDVPLFA